MNDFLILLIHSFRAIFVHMNIAQSTKVAYTLKNHPDLLFLQLGENPGESDYIEQLKNEVEWINKFRDSNLDCLQIVAIKSECRPVFCVLCVLL
jgi:hypothetical protein